MIGQRGKSQQDTTKKNQLNAAPMIVDNLTSLTETGNQLRLNSPVTFSHSTSGGKKVVITFCFGGGRIRPACSLGFGEQGLASTRPSKCLSLSLRVEESVTALVTTGLFLLEAASPFLPSSCTFQSNERKDHLDVLLGIEF